MQKGKAIKNDRRVYGWIRFLETVAYLIKKVPEEVRSDLLDKKIEKRVEDLNEYSKTLVKCLPILEKKSFLKEFERKNGEVGELAYVDVIEVFDELIALIAYDVNI